MEAASMQSRERRWIRSAGSLFVITGLAWVVVRFVDLVPIFGTWVRQSRIELDYLFALLWAAVVGVSLLFWPVPAEDRRCLTHLWLVKCLVVLGFMLLYEWKYQGSLDAYGYYQVGLADWSGLQPVGLGEGFNNVAVLAWLQLHVLPDSFHALKVTFAMIGLAGIYLMYRAATVFIGHRDTRLLYVLGLFPSILFWSSIVGKDPIQLIGIAAYVYGVVAWMRTRALASLVWMASGVALSMLIRVWSGPILLFPLIVFPIFGTKGVLARLVSMSLVLGAFALATPLVLQYFAVEAAQDVLTRAETLTRGWEGGSAVAAPTDFTSFQTLLSQAPARVFTALFRPLPGEVNNPFGILAGMENLTLLALLAFTLLGARWRALREPLVMWAILLILTWSLLYGFASYNLGALVRFKLQILPLLILTLLYLAQTSAFPKRLSGRSDPAPKEVG
jgi:hypothetical protein